MKNTVKSHVEQQPQPDIADAEAENPTHFKNSLQELKDFSSQLHHAADYCQTSFLNDRNKGITVVDNTKDYICKAMVIIVDHLGSISSNLESCVSKSNTIPETQQRIETLKQRLLTCQQYSQKLALANIYWSADFQRYHRHYTSTTADSTTMNPESSTRKMERSPNPGLLVDNSLSISPKAEKTYFEFQATPKVKRSMLNWKLLNKREMKSRIIRRRRRAPT
ncbi:Hypothetical predicted protein [Olea europaea subsp. europaea]|uniref:Protein ABIL5 n=1 Tax=Olea europaea subsp. europaea TaxID=158383 RepID=A0A8S0VP47_OLEEU|nr:Hypothetical predicted protein [Olea europaea subsp. europaea]